MFEEYVNKIGAIISLIIGSVAVIILIGCIVYSLIFVINEFKDKRKAKKTARKEIVEKKGEFYKLKRIDCQETDENKRKLYEVMQNFKEFCNKYKILFTIENFQWYIETQLTCYKYKEEEK